GGATWLSELDDLGWIEGEERRETVTDPGFLHSRGTHKSSLMTGREESPLLCFDYESDTLRIIDVHGRRLKRSHFALLVPGTGDRFWQDYLTTGAPSAIGRRVGKLGAKEKAAIEERQEYPGS